MRQVEIKLSKWHELYKELGTVERRLADAVLSEAHQRQQELRAEALSLRVQCEQAYAAFSAALAASKREREESTRAREARRSRL